MSTEKAPAITATGAYVVHPKKQNLSFGRWAIPVMETKMHHPDPLIRKKAVQSLSDFVFDSRRVASKEFSSISPTLKALCGDTDELVRETVAQCLGSVTATASGRRVFEQQDFCKEALNLLEDESAPVRKATHLFLQRLVISLTATEALVTAGAIPKLIDRVPKEPDDILEILLHTLHKCCAIDDEQAVLSNGLETVSPLLGNQCPGVREKAATVIKDLTVEPLGRSRVEASLVRSLLDLCSDEDSRVKAKSLSALMMIAIGTPAKFKAIEDNATETLLPLAKSEDIEIRLNAIKILTALGEAPAGREILLQNSKQVVVLLNEKNEEILKATKKLHAIVKCPNE